MHIDIPTERPRQTSEIAIVPGMENIQREIMIPFGQTGADLITKHIRQGKNIVTGCFLNGAVIPVAQTIAQLRRDMFEGTIDEEIFYKAMDSITLYERVRKLDPATDRKYTIATIEHPDVSRSVDVAINFDDIGETLETTDDLQATFPNAEIILAAAVKKHKTNAALKAKGYRSHFVCEVDDEWIFSGCGMDGSNSFEEDVSPYQLAQLSVLQRCSNNGTFQKGKQPLSFQQQYNYFCCHDRLLPWVTQLRSYNCNGRSSHDQGLLNDLTDLEQAKMSKDYTTQMELGYQIITNFAQLNYDDVIRMTSRRFT